MSLLTEGQEKITKAKTKLVLKHPFFSILALSLLFRNATEDGMPIVDTMGTDGRHIWWDEEFVDKCSVLEVVGVIAHEILHVVFMHMLRRGIRDPLIWNIACDYAINHIVIEAGLTLPSDALMEPKYKGWLVDAIYDDLIKKGEELKKRRRLGRPCEEGEPGNRPGNSKGPKVPSEGKGDQPGNKPSDEKGDQPGGSGGGKPQDGKGDGKTPLWGTVMEPRNDDGTPMSDADKVELQEEIKIKIVQAATAAKSIGKLPVALEGLVKAVGKPTVDWRAYIQDWVSGKTPDNYTWKRPNKKMLGLYNLITPSMQFNGAGIGVISIDTSGSVSNEELVKYVTEVMGVVEICNPEKVYIMQHDVVVHNVDVWEQGDDFSHLKITHRGGTCITPSFKKAAKFDEQINWMICFTDMGINDFPLARNAPDFPVLWAATGPDIAPFGTYISLRDPIGAVS